MIWIGQNILPDLLYIITIIGIGLLFKWVYNRSKFSKSAFWASLIEEKLLSSCLTWNKTVKPFRHD